MSPQPEAAPDSLNRRLGGYDVIAAVADDFLAWGLVRQTAGPVLCRP
jgi:hypothetical protein